MKNKLSFDTIRISPCDQNIDGKIERTAIVQYRTLFSAAQMFNPFIRPKRFFNRSFGAVPEQAKIGQKAFSDWLY